LKKLGHARCHLAFKGGTETGVPRIEERMHFRASPEQSRTISVNNVPWMVRLDVHYTQSPSCVSSVAFDTELKLINAVERPRLDNQSRVMRQNPSRCLARNKSK